MVVVILRTLDTIFFRKTWYSNCIMNDKRKSNMLLWIAISCREFAIYIYLETSKFKSRLSCTIIFISFCVFTSSKGTCSLTICFLKYLKMVCFFVPHHLIHLNYRLLCVQPGTSIPSFLMI